MDVATKSSIPGMRVEEAFGQERNADQQISKTISCADWQGIVVARMFLTLFSLEGAAVSFYHGSTRRSTASPAWRSGESFRKTGRLQVVPRQSLATRDPFTP